VLRGIIKVLKGKTIKAVCLLAQEYVDYHDLSFYLLVEHAGNRIRKTIAQQPKNSVAPGSISSAYDIMAKVMNVAINNTFIINADRSFIIKVLR
jgi:hypothetical protein